MSRARLACPHCGTQWAGNRDACPFCHRCTHLIGGHVCRECREYIPTVAEQRALDRIAADTELSAIVAHAVAGAIEIANAPENERDAVIRAVVERNLRRTIPALPMPAHYTHATAAQHG